VHWALGKTDWLETGFLQPVGIPLHQTTDGHPPDTHNSPARRYNERIDKWQKWAANKIFQPYESYHPLAAMALPNSLEPGHPSNEQNPQAGILFDGDVYSLHELPLRASF